MHGPASAHAARTQVLCLHAQPDRASDRAARAAPKRRHAPPPSRPPQAKGPVLERSDLKNLLAGVAAGTVPVDNAYEELLRSPTADLGYASLDLQRGVRQGVSEVVYGAGKTAGQICGICRALAENGQRRIMVTRLDADKARDVADALGQDGALPPDLRFSYFDVPRMGVVGEAPEPDGAGFVVVCCAGTSDLPVAEEAALTAEMLGNRTRRLYDVGVAGIHRLLAHGGELADASAVVAVAGMEGALASVVGGLVGCPVIAVPTSVGYGASFGGVAALLAMLNSCASGVSVVNIDNGFGAGYQASLINHPRAAACG